MTTTTVDFESLSGPELVSTYCAMVEQATAAGLEGYRPVARFADKLSAVRRCEAIASSLRARGEGLRPKSDSGYQASYMASEGNPSLAAVSGTASDQHVLGTAEDTKDLNEPPVSPGRARLLAHPDAEVIRQRTLADQEAAVEAVAPTEENEVAKAKKAKKTKKAPKTNGGGEQKYRATIFTSLKMWNDLLPTAERAGIEGLKARRSKGFIDKKTAVAKMSELVAAFRSAKAEPPAELLEEVRLLKA